MFAASLLYFRLYADLEREQQQYEMIAKVGLSKKRIKTDCHATANTDVLSTITCSSDS